MSDEKKKDTVKSEKDETKKKAKPKVRNKLNKTIEVMNAKGDSVTRKVYKDDNGVTYINLIDTPLPTVPLVGNSHHKFVTYIKPRLDDITVLVAHGYSQDTIGKMLNMSRASIEKMIYTEPELREAFDIGYEMLYDKLELTMYNTALGNIRLKTVKKTVNSAGKQSIEETIRDVAPDTGSLIFILKNKRADKWKDVKFVDMDTTDAFVSGIEKLSTQIKSIKMTDSMELINTMKSDIIDSDKE